MLKKTVTYEDYNGNTRTEDLYFFLSKSELMQIELSTPGGFAKKLENIVQNHDGKEITETFREIILSAYGEKSDDGRSFVKKRNGVKLSEAFEQTEAFNQLFTELLLDPNKAAAFINGIMPKDLMEDAKNNKEIQARLSELSNTDSDDSDE